MSRNKATSFAVLLGVCVLPATAEWAELPSFENYTETSTRGWHPVPAPLAKRLLQARMSAAEIAWYRKEGGLPRNWGKALVEKEIPVNLKGEKVYFVRPGTEPYYGALYGAHLYWHWVVVNGHEVFWTGSDGFRLLDGSHHGMRDFEDFGGNAVVTAYSHMRFDGRVYQIAACTIHEVGTGTDLGSCDNYQSRENTEENVK